MNTTAIAIIAIICWAIVSIVRSGKDSGKISEKIAQENDGLRAEIDGLKDRIATLEANVKDEK